MKKISLKAHKVLKVGLIVGLIAFISSCEMWIDPDINIDPDAPADVPMNLLVPAIQQTMGFNLMGNNAVRTTNLWMQLYDGIERQSHTETRYQLTAADVNSYWGNIYTEILINAKILAEKAVENESPHYAGIAKVMTAYTLGVTSDLFGDIPYSDALQGAQNNVEAEFDTQQEVYNSIFSLLDDALVDLAATDNAIDVDGDVIYDGDVDAWINAARAIKARAELQLSGVNGATAYTNALALVDAFTGNADDMDVPFAATSQNPVFQFLEQRTDFRICQTFLDELNATTDPRLADLVAEDGDGLYTGSIPGGENAAASFPGDFIAAEDASVTLMSYAELKFIEAEAALGSSDAVRAASAYKAAVAASVSKITGATNQAWLDANINTETDATITLEKIIMQKRIALVGQVQPFSDWRRTGFPVLALAIGATKTEVPRRFPYPQDETIYNPDNVPSVASIIDPVWWDQ